jgi:hypothetical protein
MIGRDPALVVTPADDLFHPPTSDNEAWLETLWFPFFVPGAGLSVSTRLWFSANRGMQGGACMVWQGNDTILHSDRWLETMDGTPDLTQLTLQDRGSLRRLAPLAEFQLSYSKGPVAFSVTFAATMAPNPVDPSESPGMFDGHFEQPGRVSGQLAVGDDHYGVDCHTLRDRSWGPRQMVGGLRLGNAYGGRDGMSFFTYIQPDDSGTEHITGGFLSTAEGDASLVSGVRTTTWRGGWPAAVTIEAEDALGRSLQLSGQCRNRFASNAGHGIYGILNLVEWKLVGESLWGENHDIWSEQDWLAAGRPRLP